MKTLLLNAMTHIEPAYVESASKAMEEGNLAKSRRPLRYLLIAATLTLILVAILLPIALGEDPVSTPEITTPQTPTTTEKVYASLLDIPGASASSSAVADKPNDKVFSGMIQGSPKKEFQENWAQNVRNNYSFVVGKVLEHTSVDIPTEEGFYRLYTFTVEIDEILRDKGNKSVEGLEIFTAVYGCHYLPYEESNGTLRYRITTPYHPYGDKTIYCDLGAMALEVAYRTSFELAFQLESSEGLTLALNGEELNFSDYAPFYMTGSFGRADKILAIYRYGFSERLFYDEAYYPEPTLKIWGGQTVPSFANRIITYDHTTPADYIGNLETRYLVLYATPQNIERRILPSSKTAETDWFLISFELTLTDVNLLNLPPLHDPEKTTVRVLCATQYRKVGEDLFEALTPNADDLTVDTLDGAGLFVLASAFEQPLSYDGHTGYVYHNFDYVLLDAFESDGKTVLFPLSENESVEILLEQFRS